MPVRRIRCISTFERRAYERGFTAVAGVDEVGRGSLFGPVVAAAVILNPERPITGLKDSKIIDAPARGRLCKYIQRHAVCWSVGLADVFEIDSMNIYQASRLAMTRAVQAMSVPPDYLLVDALRLDVPAEQEPLIDGDARCRAIAAASIVAKVYRDGCLDEWDRVFPQYHLKENKGYSTPAHKRALREYGPTFLHRFSFEPVRESTSEVFWTSYSNPETAE